MRSQALLLLPLLCALTVGCAGETTSRPGEPLLWRVQAPGGAAGWVLGTLHQGVSLHGDLSGSIREALQRADRLTLEADLRDVPAQDFLARIRLPAGQALDGMMPDSTWAKLTGLVPGVSAASLRTFRPWYAGSLLVQILTPNQARLEDELLSAAASGQQELSFLESWQLQVDLMNALSEERALAQLIEAVEGAAAVTERIQALIAAYRSGDLERVARAGLAAGAYPAQGSPEYEPLLVGRNRSWLPRVEELLQQGSAFIAVGFGHLLGEDGLLQLLGAKGYQLSRVP